MQGTFSVPTHRERIVERSSTSAKALQNVCVLVPDYRVGRRAIRKVMQMRNSKMRTPYNIKVQ